MKIGIDIGGSHISVGLIEGNGLLDIIEKDFFYKNDFKNFGQEIIIQIVDFIDEILNKNNLTLERIETIGIASPGTISNGIIVKAGNLDLHNFDILSELKKYYNIPILIRNDGKCAALAEKKYGVLQNYDDCVFINIGTGIGGAVFMNGKLLVPKKYSGFEIGHIVVEPNGKKCTCGKKGCIEAYASMKCLKNNISKILEIDNEISGIDLKKILLENNDSRIDNCVEEFLEYLKIEISNLIDIFEPEAICFGGSFSYYENTKIWDKFIEKLNQPNLAFNNDLPQFVTAKLQNNAGIIGSVIFQ